MTTTAEAGLRIDGLSIGYGQNQIVHEASMSCGDGETLAIVGPSGCGKSTLLKSIAGLVPPTAGSIRVNGRELTALAPQRRNLGYVPQNYALFPSLSVVQNVEFGLRRRIRSASERRRTAREFLDFVRLADFADRRPGELSGGQRQRVALARALAISPEIVLLDEPLSALDPQLRTSMRHQLRDLLREAGCGCVIVTHDRTEALALGDRVAVMREGRVLQLGTPQELWERPADAFVAAFLNDTRMLPAQVSGSELVIDVGTGTWRLPMSVARAHTGVASPRGVLIRPGDLEVTDEGAGTRAQLVRTEYVGGTLLATVRVGDVELTANAGESARLGSEVLIAPRPGALGLV